ncbi:TRM11 family SAM-dependent methyltransferase [Crassaminicella profunda]|uniref:TRM11 family SAM-dependent methyltransferase n=1 Tax=Crassaminicella profunda TaxID=1286698 RepID=UPI001CA78F9C|nr:SAM-dependent methyltransferase [Crassaminicella profunda]QZY56838.1 SAM-dependent methyltransferase [Crassaminicella profunda]
MKLNQYIYNVNYQVQEEDLCALEIRSLFNFHLEGKVFFSSKEVEPSISPFLKTRLKIIYKTSSFSDIIELIKKDKITSQDFVVKYLELFSGDPYIKKRKELCKEIGLVVEGFPSFTSPKTTFGISFYKGSWYFGILVANNSEWKAHNTKPYSYSSSIGINIAKVLLNIAGNGDFSKRLVDPCCGVGTVLLEGFFAGYDIRGWEIMSKVAEHARANLLHFNYLPKVTTGDIQDIGESFDASIIDLPYGNFCPTNVDNQVKIIKNAKRISKKLVLVSCEDITHQILREKLKITDCCKISKNEKGSFYRYIWVCE